MTFLAESNTSMLSECAEIIQLHEDGLTVRSRRPAACAKCERGEGCGGGLVGRLLRNPDQTLFVNTQPDSAWEKGQSVQLLIPASTVLRLAAVAYGLPLLGVMLGALIASFVSENNALTILSAVAGLVAGIVAARLYLRHASDRMLQPQLAPLPFNE